MTKYLQNYRLILWLIDCQIKSDLLYNIKATKRKNKTVQFTTNGRNTASEPGLNTHWWYMLWQTFFKRWNTLSREEYSLAGIQFSLHYSVSFSPFLTPPAAGAEVMLLKCSCQHKAALLSISPRATPCGVHHRHPKQSFKEEKHTPPFSPCRAPWRSAQRSFVLRVKPNPGGAIVFQRLQADASFDLPLHNLATSCCRHYCQELTGMMG